MECSIKKLKKLTFRIVQTIRNSKRSTNRIPLKC